MFKKNKGKIVWNDNRYHPFSYKDAVPPLQDPFRMPSHDGMFITFGVAIGSRVLLFFFLLFVSQVFPFIMNGIRFGRVNKIDF